MDSLKTPAISDSGVKYDVKRVISDPSPSQKVSKPYAQRLKVAGFIQELAYGNYYYTDDINLANILESVVTPIATAKEFWKAPTCYELMCACLSFGNNVEINGTTLQTETTFWTVRVGNIVRTGYNLADNLADAWISLSKL